jgi:hypothetical protein
VTAWLFLVFSGLVGLVVYLHFLLAHKEWKRSKGSQSSEIDPDYVRKEDFLAQSFRAKVSEWLERAASMRRGPDGCLMDTGREWVRVIAAADYRPGSTVDEVLLSEGDFSCGAGCAFLREVYVRRHGRLEAGARLQSIAADGSLALGPGVIVVRWADSVGEMDLGEGAIVQWRATSHTRVRLAPGAQAGSIYAPEIATAGLRQTPSPDASQRTGEMVEIPPPPGPPQGLAAQKPVGFDPGKLVRLSPDCWLYRGDLELALPLRLKSKLVVKGDFSCPAGSILEQDLKADGWLRIGEDSVCLGNLVAGGQIHLGRGTRFHDVVHAGQTLQLCRGVRGCRDHGPVAVYAADWLLLEQNVAVRGKLASARQVVAVAAASAELEPVGARPREVEAEVMAAR